MKRVSSTPKIYIQTHGTTPLQSRSPSLDARTSPPPLRPRPDLAHRPSRNNVVLSRASRQKESAVAKKQPVQFSVKTTYSGFREPGLTKTEPDNLKKPLKFLPLVNAFSSPKLQKIPITEDFVKRFEGLESDRGYYRNLLEISTEDDQEISPSKDALGGASSIHFYSQNRRTDRLKQKYSQDNIFSTASAAILSKCDTENLLPLKIGMLKSNNNTDFDVNIR